MMTRGMVAMSLVFALLMACKLLLLLYQPLPVAWHGDAGDYVAKALYFHEHAKFRQIQSDSSGRTSLAYSDFRPPGYPLFIAAFLSFGTTVPAITQSVRLAHFGLDLATTLILLAVVWRFHTAAGYRWIAVLVLGVQPWTSAFIVTLNPDTLTAFLLVSGVALLALFVTHQGPWARSLALLGASGLLSLTFLVRPEMILFSFAVTLLGLARSLPGLSWKTLTRYALLAAIPFLAIVGANMAYRWQVAQEVRVYGEFRHATPGLVQWTKTWTGPQTLKEQVIWGPLAIGPDAFAKLPDGVFTDDSERQQLTAVVRAVAERGSITPEEDRLFGLIATKRTEVDPWSYYLWNRLYSAGHLWINLSNAAHYLNAFAFVPRPVSKALTASFFGLKLMILGFFVIGILRFPYRGYYSDRKCWLLTFLLIGMSFVLLRTLYIGFYLGIPEYRYALIAWPFVLSLSLFGIAQIWPGGKGFTDCKTR